MKHRRVRTSLVGVAVVACAAAAAPTSGQDVSAFQRILDDSVKANRIVGAQAAVRIPGRSPWTGVAGTNRPGEPMRPDLMIGTGSITKMYTAIAAVVLVDRGVISLGDTVGRWFPGLANVDPAITVEQLVSQTSGIADALSNPALSQLVRAEPNRVWEFQQMLPYIGQPLFARGQGWNASNSNRILLGLIVERESGMSLASFLKKELFKGSRSSWLSGDGPAPALLATQWVVNTSGELVNANDNFFTTSLLSMRREVQASAADVAAFGELVFRGPLLSKGMKEKVRRTIPSDGRIPGEVGGGLGIRVYNYLGRTVYGHSGGTNNNTSLMLHDPATGITVAVTINQGGNGHGNAQFRMAPAILKAAIESAKR